jgi:hypothetical protein
LIAIRACWCIPRAGDPFGEAVERHLDLRIGAGAVGDAGGIVGDERGIEGVDIGG